MTLILIWLITTSATASGTTVQDGIIASKAHLNCWMGSVAAAGPTSARM